MFKAYRGLGFRVYGGWDLQVFTGLNLGLTLCFYTA